VIQIKLKIEELFQNILVVDVSFKPSLPNDVTSVFLKKILDIIEEKTDGEFIVEARACFVYRLKEGESRATLIQALCVLQNKLLPSGFYMKGRFEEENYIYDNNHDIVSCFENNKTRTYTITSWEE
jgi:hypothetical protein